MRQVKIPIKTCTLSVSSVFKNMVQICRMMWWSLSYLIQEIYLVIWRASRATLHISEWKTYEAPLQCWPFFNWSFQFLWFDCCCCTIKCQAHGSSPFTSFIENGILYICIQGRTCIFTGCGTILSLTSSLRPAVNGAATAVAVWKIRTGGRGNNWRTFSLEWPLAKDVFLPMRLV